MMNKLIVALCTVVMLGSAGSVLAKDHKLPICHNGSTYDEDAMMEIPFPLSLPLLEEKLQRLWISTRLIMVIPIRMRKWG